MALISGFFVAGLDVSLFEWLLLAIPADDRPRYVAMNTALANLVAFLAPVIGAAVADWAGLPPILFASSFCLFDSAAMACRLAGSRASEYRPGKGLAT